MQLFLSNYHNNGLKSNSTPLRLSLLLLPATIPNTRFCPVPSFLSLYFPSWRLYPHAPPLSTMNLSPPSIYDNKCSLSFIHSLSMLIISYITEHRFSLSFGHCAWIFHISVWSLGNHTRISQTQRHREKKQHSLPAFLNPHTIRLLSYPFQSLKTNSNSSLASTLLKCLPH